MSNNVQISTSVPFLVEASSAAAKRKACGFRPAGAGAAGGRAHDFARFFGALRPSCSAAVAAPAAAMRRCWFGGIVGQLASTSASAGGRRAGCGGSRCGNFYRAGRARRRCSAFSAAAAAHLDGDLERAFGNQGAARAMKAQRGHGEDAWMQAHTCFY